MWRQGEHVALIGDTGSGKSYLEAELLKRREYVIVLKTKPDDDDDEKFPKAEYRRIRSITQMDASQNKYLLQPEFAKQRIECGKALLLAFRAGGWTVAVDELFYATQRLRLGSEVEMLLTQGRSKHVTVIAGMQRPTGVTRYAISQATHVFTFASEGRDVKIISEATTERAKKVVPLLPQHHFWYWNRRTRQDSVNIAQNVGSVL